MKALICGIGGQDGAYLASELLAQGYQLVGTSRDAKAGKFDGLRKLGLLSHIELVSMTVTDFRSVMSTISDCTPDEIYNLSGQSSVALSFDQPVEAVESIAVGTLNLLEAIRIQGGKARFYNAGSSECFGNTLGQAATEETPFKPRSPYAVAKVTAHNLVENYREAYSLFACTGILFNHESPLRPERFVTQKIVQAAARIAAGSDEKLYLGNLDIQRDWGWAPDYVNAMWRMLRQDKPEDFIVATGRTESLAYFAEKAFGHFDLDWRRHVLIDEHLLRPSDIQVGRAHPEKAAKLLDWRALTDIDGVVEGMCRGL